MAYYVLDPSGAQYGPADLALLQVWQREGRILASTSVRDEQTGVTLPASSIPGLFPTPYSGGPYNPGPASPYGCPPGSPYAPPPSGYSPYGPPGRLGSGRNDITVAWIMAICGIVMGACFCPLLGLGLGIGGWYFAKRAGQYGEPGAQGPMIASYFAIAIGALFLVLGVAFRAMLGF